MRNSLYSVSVEEALSSVGGSLRYQKHMLLVICGIWLSQALSMINLPYLLSHPDSECTDDNCCSQYSQQPEIQILNPAYEWELICSKKYKSTLISLFYFTGLGLGTCLVSYLANRVGRKITIVFCLIFTAITQFLSVFSPSPEFFMVTSLFSGVFVGGCNITSFVYLNECISGEVRHVYTGFIFCAWGVGMTVMSILNLTIEDWRTHMIIISISNLLWVPFLSRFYESPRFLAANKGKYAEARIVLNRIAIYNKKGQFTEMLEGEKMIGYQESGTISSVSSPCHSPKFSFVPITSGVVSVTESEVSDVKKYHFLDLLKLKSIRVPLILTAFIWFSVSLAYYTTVFSIPHYLGHTQLNSILVAIAEIFSCIIVAFLLNKIGRQLSFVVNFAMAGISCILALAFIAKEYPSETVLKTNKVFQVILISFSRFAIVSIRLTSYIYTVEYFPTNIRSLVFGLVGFISVIGGILSPALIELGNVLNIHGLFFVGILLIGGSFGSCLLPETLNKTMEDYIEEEKDSMHSPKSQTGIEIPSKGFKKFQEE